MTTMLARRARRMMMGLAAVALVAGCGDDVTGPNGSGNLTFTIEGTDVSVDATWRELPNNRFRIQWEETNSTGYRNVEIDLYGNTPGNYTVMASPSAAGQAGFQYYTQIVGMGNKNYQGASGTIVLTSASATEMSGTFTLNVTAAAGGAPVAVTNGTFTAVPKQ